MSKLRLLTLLQRLHDLQLHVTKDIFENDIPSPANSCQQKYKVVEKFVIEENQDKELLLFFFSQKIIHF